MSLPLLLVLGLVIGLIVGLYQTRTFSGSIPAGAVGLVAGLAVWAVLSLM